MNLVLLRTVINTIYFIYGFLVHKIILNSNKGEDVSF